MNVRITLLLIIFIVSYKNLFSQATVLQDYSGITTQQGNPQEFTEYNGYLYFSAASDETGRELWRTDGTVAGSQLFLDIGEYTKSGNPRCLTLFNSLIYFFADNGVDGNQLWKTDGTPAGTAMVTNWSGADPADLIVCNGTLFFSNDISAGRELWKSDGTASGTMQVKDIYPGTSSSLISTPGTPNFTVFNNKLYFFCNDGTNGNEFWESNGTSSGTVLVKDINPGSASSYVGSSRGMIIMNGQLYFIAYEPLNGGELWKSDGTANGTQLVSDIRIGTGSSNPEGLTVMGNHIYFSADDGVVSRELWKSDGTTAGTELVKDILVGTNGTGPDNLFNANGTLYFSASSTSGIELFKSDGTTLGTVLVKDIYTGAPSSEPKNFVVYNSLVYFQAMSLNNGTELWRTDGTAAGTVLVKAISPGIGGSSPNNFKVFANKLVFVANEYGLVNMELWCTDGTTAGTILLRDINMGNNSSEVNEWVIHNDRLLFRATNVNNGRELFKSDGTTAGTGLLMDIFTGSSNHGIPRNLISMGSHAYFFARNSSSQSNPKLYRTDGTLAGTTVISTQFDVTQLEFVIGNTLYFFVNNVPNDRLYKTDGFSAPVLVTQLSSGGNGVSVVDNITDNHIVINNVFYFVAGNSDIGHELWRTDGTAAGTYLLKNIAASFNSSDPRDFVDLNGVLYFTANDYINGRELWKSDGTTAGTILLKDIYAGASASNPKELIVSDGEIYFSALHPSYGRELWISDGTSAGTIISNDLEPGPISSSPLHLTKGLGRFWFSAATSSYGRELWQKVGNASPVMGADIFPGSPSSNPANFKVIDGELYFGATNGINGGEPYRTLGSSCSTVSLGDLSPGDVGSYPEFLGKVNDKILFVATTPFYGRELMSVDAPEQINSNVSGCYYYVWNATGDTLINPGIYSTIVQGQSGCDSLIHINLTINYPDTIIDNQTACVSFTWMNGVTYTSSTNTPVFVTSTANGCDTTYLLHLIINQPSQPYSLNHTVCSSFTWDFNGQTYTSSGQYTDTIMTSSGCDSIATLNLTVNSSSAVTDVQTACDSYTWIDGNTYTTSTNSPTMVFQNAAGCDSIITLNLTITHSTFGTDVQTACDSYTWIDGNTYTSSTNTPTVLLQNAAGCDSIVTLSLTIGHPDTVTDVQTACDSYTWIDGNTYTTSTNTPTFLLQSTTGCDSTVTLNLTITHSNTGTDVQTACDSYTWIDGNTYTSSTNTPTFILQNTEGCDSIVTLDLVITHSSAGIDIQTSCDPIVWIDGNTYATSTSTPTFMLQNSVGCDSMVTLNLTILSTSGVDAQTNCDSYTWIDGNTYTSSTNTPTVVLQNAAGCDSIVTLNLIIIQSTTGTDIQTACDSYTWIDGNTYTSSTNTPTFILQNAAGCDSVVTLNLAILPVVETTEQVSHCGPFTWPLNGQTYGFSGQYTDTLQTVNGCDSIVQLNLSIHSIPTSNIIDNGDATFTAVYSGFNQWIECMTGTVVFGGSTFAPQQNGNYALVAADGVTGCSDTSACFLVDYLSIDSKDLLSLSLSPNPTNNEVHISFSGPDTELTVYDVHGKVVLKDHIQNQEIISLQNFERGVYLFDFSNSNGHNVQRVVKQ